MIGPVLTRMEQVIEPVKTDSQNAQRSDSRFVGLGGQGCVAARGGYRCRALAR